MAALGSDDMRLLPLEEAMVLQALSGEAPWADVEQVVIDLNRAAPDLQAIAPEVAALVTRHSFVSTLVRLDDLGKPRFVPAKDILPNHSAPLPPSGVGWTDGTLADWLSRDRNFGFDLKRDLGWRLTLFRRDGNRCRLVLTFHHAKADLTSMAQITTDLLTALLANKHPTNPTLPGDAWRDARIGLWSVHDETAARAFLPITWPRVTRLQA
jgi:hypothetical protein